MNILILSYFLFQLCFYFVASMNYDMYKSLIKGFKNLKFKNMFYYVYSFIILTLLIIFFLLFLFLLFHYYLLILLLHKYKFIRLQHNINNINK